MVDQKEATDVVLKMALERGEKTKEGEALRIMLRELREQRIVGREVELVLAPAITSLENAVEELEKAVGA